MNREQRLNYLDQNPQIKKVFFASETTDLMWELGKKSGLSDNQTSLLAKDVGLVLLNEMSRNSFQSQHPKESNEIKEAIFNLALGNGEVQGLMNKYEKELEELELPLPQEFHRELEKHEIKIE